MIPSSTVENYLKAILLHQVPDEATLVPMGLIAVSLGVTPGTATTMVKALAESGLVLYEPYTGVRLSPAGEKLAALVLRRHRLVELFLVQVMGLNWDEVHQEAEKLEHVVSERLIERMDEMLGRPEVDPHGDPIPDADGAIPQRDFKTLLTCPLHIPVTVTRVLDQDAEFLRFIESHELKPGQAVEVEARDAMADSVLLRGRDDRRTTIGTRAASKLLVDVVTAVLAVLTLFGGVARAQAPANADSPAGSPFGISDNSFLVEEAFNQEPGIFQNIFVFERSGPRGWNLGFVQEWPVTTMRHQFSYTLNFARDGGSARFSDTAVNYRYQLWMEDSGRPAFSPRVSLLLSRDDNETGLDEGTMGLEMNLPFSKRVGPTYFHWNGGIRWYPRVWTGSRLLPVEADHVALTTPFAAGSAIFAVRPMFNLMLEAVLESDESVFLRNRTERETVFTLLPGARGGWNVGDAQLVLGVAVPFVRQAGETDTGILGYLSYELPFDK
jgi:DtxR family transcriptional regulator, Mn-dependent transcriptional regulator